MTRRAPLLPPQTPPPAVDVSRLRGLAFGIAALAVAIRIWMACATHETGEDALIILRYAEQIAQGHGFVYNMGERVLGSTTPLYTLLLALAACCHLDAEMVGKGCCILADGLTCLLIARLMARREAGRPIFGLFAALLYAVGSTPISISISGMETALVTCAGMAAILAYAQGHTRALAALTALLFLLRIDTLALSILLVGARLLRDRRVPWRDLTLALLIVLPWIVFATLYFGSPVPTSLIAKLTVYRGAWGASRSDILAAFAVQFTAGWFQRIVTLLFLVSAVHIVGAASTSRWRGERDPHEGDGAGNIEPERRRSRGAEAREHDDRQADLFVPLLWMMIYYGVMLTSHVPAFGWYFLPPWPLYLCVAALGVSWLTASVARRLPSGLSMRGREVWPAALLLFGLFGLWHLRSVRAEIARSQRLEDRVRRPLGLWLRAHAGAQERILLEPIGTIGYYSQRQILDMIGLVSPEVFASYRTSHPLADIVRRFHPAWLCLRPNEAALLARFDPDVFKTDYRYIRAFETAPGHVAFALYHIRQRALSPTK